MSNTTKCIFKDKDHEWVSDCRDYDYWGEIDKEVEIVEELKSNQIYENTKKRK